MTLAEFAHLTGTKPKWVLNTLAALRRHGQYSLELARQLGVARALHDALGLPLARAFALAGGALHAYRGGTEAVRVATDDQDVSLTVDVARVLASVNVRASALQSSVAPRQRGRRAARRSGRNALQAAADRGIDIGLLVDNRRKTPEQRLRQLDAMAAFARDVRRVTR